MNNVRLLFTAGAAFVAYFAKYPAVYRSQDAIQGVMPTGRLAMLTAMLNQGGSEAWASHIGSSELS